MDFLNPSGSNYRLRKVMEPKFYAEELIRHPNHHLRLCWFLKNMKHQEITSPSFRPTSLWQLWARSPKSISASDKTPAGNSASFHPLDVHLVGERRWKRWINGGTNGGTGGADEGSCGGWDLRFVVCDSRFLLDDGVVVVVVLVVLVVSSSLFNDGFALVVDDDDDAHQRLEVRVLNHGIGQFSKSTGYSEICPDMIWCYVYIGDVI